MKNKTRQEGILCPYGKNTRPSQSARQRQYGKAKTFIHDILGIIAAVIFLSLADSGSILLTLLGAAGLGLVFWRASKAYPIQRKDDAK